MKTQINTDRQFVQDLSVVVSKCQQDHVQANRVLGTVPLVWDTISEREIAAPGTGGIHFFIKQDQYTVMFTVSYSIKAAMISDNTYFNLDLAIARAEYLQAARMWMLMAEENSRLRNTLEEYDVIVGGVK